MMVTASLGTRCDQHGGWQGGLDPLVAELDVMMLTQLVAEVGDVEAGVLFPVQAQDLLDSRQRDFAGAVAGVTAIEQVIVIVSLVTVFPAAHGAAGEAENLGGLPPRHLSANGFYESLLELSLHAPLRGSANHSSNLLWWMACCLSRPERPIHFQRSYHLLSTSDEWLLDQWAVGC